MFYSTDFSAPTSTFKSEQIVASSVFSSPEEYHLPLRWIAISSAKAGCTLAASTGVHDGETLIKMILAGASAVEVASTLYKNGLGRIKAKNDASCKLFKRQ